jgi:hypothetical protein
MVNPDRSLEDLLLEADDLILQARSARKKSDFVTAERALSAAIALLEPELRGREAHLGTIATAMGASEDRKALAVRLADCYGPLGGIARRAGDFQKAFELYSKGRNLELQEGYDIASTYNRVQWIVAQILIDPTSIADPGGSLAEQAKAMLKLLDQSIVKDAWTSADVLLLAALLDDRRGARKAWNALVAARPIRDVYESGLPVLQALAARLPGNEPLSDAIRNYQSQLSVAVAR